MTDVQIIKKPDNCHYMPDRGWRFEPLIAKNRKELADFYRSVRRDGKADLARLLFLTQQACGAALARNIADAVLNGTSGHVGGLGAFRP